MKYEVEKLKGEVKISFTVTEQEWQEELDKAYNKTKFKYSIPGFRKGHATRKLIERNYGEGVFFDDAFNECFKKSYYTAITEADLQPVDDPQVSFDDAAEGLKFTSVTTVRPEVKLGQYKGIKLNKAEYIVKDADVDAEITSAQQRASREVEVEGRAVKDGDIIMLDYSGSIDGVKFDGGTAENQRLVIGSNSFIPGFEEKCIGLKVGESKDIDLKFPAEYHAAELAGKDCVFAVTIRAIKEKQLPELNDQFAADVSEFETMDEYKKSIRERLETEGKERADRENENTAVDAVVANAEVDVPDCMINSELDYQLRDLEYNLSYSYGGMKLEDYFRYTGSSEKDFREQRKDFAAKNVKARLVLEDIIKAESLEASDEDMNEMLERIAAGSGKTTEEYRASLSDSQLGYIKSDVLMKNALKFIKDNNIFEAGAAKKTTAAKKPAAKKADAAEETAKKPAAKKPAAKKAAAKE